MCAFTAGYRLNDEVVLRELSITGSCQVEEECLIKQPVSGISGLAGKIQLGGENTPAGTLDFEMDMPRATGINRGHDRVEPPAPLGVGELVSAQAKTQAVIVTFLVGVPDLDETAG